MDLENVRIIVRRKLATGALPQESLRGAHPRRPARRGSDQRVDEPGHSVPHTVLLHVGRGTGPAWEA